VEHGHNALNRTSAVDTSSTQAALPADQGRAAYLEPLRALTLDQKIALLTGVDNFTLPGEPRIGLRGLSVSDGPAGVRGPRLDPADRSSSPPAPIALAATWDPELVERVAAQLGAEARAKGIDVVLGPTLNFARTPYGGRGFESFGEDPVLAARIVAGYVRGLQSAGVAATAKHYVGNDSETERWTVDVRVDETTLREFYLVPFEACVTEAGCAMVMAGYNSVNGTSMTEHGHLLGTVLKREWGFSGAVVSDWFAARSTESTALAGLDLVMPGPEGPWGPALAEAVARGAVPESEIDDKVLRLLRVADLVGALDGVAARNGSSAPAAAGDPELDGDGSAHHNGVVPRPGPHADRGALRDAAAASFVLLRNSAATLPLGRVGSIALIGPNAVDPQFQGRGSAEVGLAVQVSPVEGLRQALAADAQSGSEPATRLRVAQGCRTWTSTPLPAPETLTEPETGGPGTRLEIYEADGVLRYAGVRPVCEVTWWDPEPVVADPGIARLVLSGTFAAPAAGRYRMAVGAIGKLRLDAAPSGSEAFTVEGIAPHPEDPMVTHAGPYEFSRDVDLAEGETVAFTASCEPDGYKHELIRFRVGFAPMPDDDALLAEAVAAAREADVAVVVVGSTATTESEGYDRRSLELPGRQDDLITAVTAANPRTVVVVNSGMPVLMPWATRAAAVLQAWFPGQEFGHALADVLLGRAEPGGRLPVTVPHSESGLPVGRAEPVDGVLEYTEGLLVGYRGYDRAGTEPLFPFGHGLGYTSWSFEELGVPFGGVRAGADVEVTVAVRNTGRRAGRVVAQAYLSGPAAEQPDGARPVRVLAGFGAAHVEPGQLEYVRLRIPARAFARWDEDAHGWAQPAGRYTVEVGGSSRDLRLTGTVEIS
jgi:beta-glucosidase